ncbi:hypothetical protein BH10PSE12_BH10PSE12_03010 [soil metagenome]
MTEIEELRAVVLAQAKLLGQMLAEASGDDAPLVLTADEGFEMLDHALGALPADLRKRYFHEIDRWYPRHSTETD